MTNGPRTTVRPDGRAHAPTSAPDPARAPRDARRGPRAVHLRAGGVSLVLALDEETRLPRIAHWGADLGALDDAGLDALCEVTRLQPIGNPVDGELLVSVVPEQSAGWLGTPGLAGSRRGAGFSTRFRVRDVRLEPAPAGWVHRLVVDADDDVVGLALRLELEQAASGVVRQRAAVRSGPGVQEPDYTLERLLVAYPVPGRATEILDFTGHHLRERSPQRTAFAHGTHLRESRRGRTGFDAAFVLAAGTPGFGHRSGEVWAVHTAWSGNHVTLAERSYHGAGLVAGGELLLPGEVALGAGDAYAGPWVYGAYGVGLDAVSARFHAMLRARPGHPSSPRKVVANTWEAVYFDHDLDRLTALARAAARVGAERFVLDDGWFGARRDDRRALGDWYVSDDVWPDGLDPLIEVVHGLGMEFGLWVEPEMVNEDSDLARAHPDWIMAPGERLPGRARNQQVLDLGNPDASAWILERLDALLTRYPIAYLKWDHNRDLVEAGHRVSGVPGVHDQTVAVYGLLDELRRRHPGLEIESCSSGGGRVDLEILARTDRIWVSDCIDAVERQQIQGWTNLLVPYELMGAHVGAPVAHTTARDLPLSFRGAAALFGHLGIEWDLTSAAEEELDELAGWVATYRELRPLLHAGVVVHADLQDPAYALHGVVAPDGGDAVFAWVATASSAVYPPPAVPLPGLDPDALYRLRPLLPDARIEGNASRWGVDVPWWGEVGSDRARDGVVVPGSVLTRAGVALPVLFPERSVLLRATRVGAA
ncbi:alpha-galactosidase [Luteimicrobium xylanilyticum]|uniref:alpha-galactosidase n=1 Tax=Luteimicrobium xylanilyticum TaxID=1133546 RepID=A0A5P9QC05_9MICO|nr:alpha-galactosidase [Luteimicrobium xylanilyticum]QFU98954.1 Alpha-galactosidase [Luteimicrobium xylanilyticum]